MNSTYTLVKYLIELVFILQVEIQVRKFYCVNKAVPTLPIIIEDAARSEAEIEKALQVLCCDKIKFKYSIFLLESL